MFLFRTLPKFSISKQWIYTNKRFNPYIPVINSESLKLSCQVTQLRQNSSVSQETKTFPHNLRNDFRSEFPNVVKQLLETEDKLEEFSSLYEKALTYNLLGGKMIRGLSMCYTYLSLVQKEDLTREKLKLMYTIGWCLELFQAFFLVIDDVQDGSLMRRGQPTWYKVPEVGLRALTDALLFESGIYKLLKKNLGGTEYYMPIVDNFLEATHFTTVGQTVDLNTINMFKSNNFGINMDRYKFIVKHKTSYYTFVLPVAIGMYLGDIFDAELHRQAKNVLLNIGHYFQVQDDYLDVFGSEEITGKKGTDIQDGKCTWLAAVVFQKGSHYHLKKFQECFGMADEDKVNTIKELYIELGLPDLFNSFEAEMYNKIVSQIQQLSSRLPHEAFYVLLNEVHKRKK